MSIRLVQRALDETPADLSPREVLALVAIAERANDGTATAWPGLAELARRCRASERTTRRILNGLVERGLLTRVGGGYRGQATMWQIQLKEDKAVATNADPKGGHSSGHLSTSKGGQSGTETRPSGDRKAATAVTPQPSEPSENNLQPRASVEPWRSAAVLEVVIEELQPHTKHAIDRDHARREAKRLLDGHATTDPIAYVRTALRNLAAKGHIADHLPTPTPPAYGGQRP